MVIYEEKPAPDERYRYLGADTFLLVWLLIVIAVITIALVAIINPRVNEIINARSEVQRIVRGGSGYEIAYEEAVSLYPVGSYQVRLEQGGLLFLDGKGRENSWQETNLLAEQIISKSPEHLIIGDKESPNFVVVKESGIIFSDKVKSKAVGADLLGDDLVLLDQGANNKGEVRYYDLKDNELKFTLEFLDSGYPLLAKIVPTQKALDILVLNTDKVEPECLLQRYGFDGQKKVELRLNNYFGSFLYESDDVLVAYRGDELAVIDISAENVSRYGVAEGFSHILSDRTGIVILGTTPGADESWLTRLTGVKEQTTMSIPLLTADPVAADGWLLLPAENNLYLFDLTDSVFASRESFTAPLRQLYLAPDGRALVITSEEVIPYLIQ
ncbi:MAG TPA: hypothetical protein GXX72_03055 [Clostridiaceae bacterium]|nr:hypothetical protein [Clostridiaceae bacterium]